MLKKISLFLFTILLINTGFSQNKEAKLVQKSFDDYKSAILNDKGEEAVNFVDSRTIKYYSEILDKSKNADSTTVSSMGLMDKLMVLTIRHKTSKQDILSFDGKGLLVYAINEGMVGKGSVMNTSIGEVEIDGTFAKGQFISNGEIAPFHFNFYKEDNAWKVDLTSIFSIGTTAFRTMQKESGYEENEYLFMLLEYMTGKKPGVEIWNTIN